METKKTHTEKKELGKNGFLSFIFGALAVSIFIGLVTSKHWHGPEIFIQAETYKTGLALSKKLAFTVLEIIYGGLIFTGIFTGIKIFITNIKKVRIKQKTYVIIVLLFWFTVVAGFIFISFALAFSIFFFGLLGFCIFVYFFQELIEPEEKTSSKEKGCELNELKSRT